MGRQKITTPFHAFHLYFHHYFDYHTVASRSEYWFDQMWLYVAYILIYLLSMLPSVKRLFDKVTFPMLLKFNITPAQTNVNQLGRMLVKSFQNGHLWFTFNVRGLILMALAVVMIFIIITSPFLSPIVFSMAFIRHPTFFYMILIFDLFTCIPSMNLWIRRIHDVGYSLLIPIIIDACVLLSTTINIVPGLQFVWLIFFAARFVFHCVIFIQQTDPQSSYSPKTYI